MRLFSSAIVFLSAPIIRANRYRDIPCKVKESIYGPPHGWVRHGPAPSNYLLQLKIALPQPHFPILERNLWEISDPNHERYGAYLSKEETNALMAPRPEALDAVNAWLTSYGIQEEDLHRSSARDWVTIRVPITLAEEMLDTKYHVYIYTDSNESIVRTTRYSLPESLHKYVELIQPTTMFNRPKPIRSALHWSNTTLSSDPSNGTIIGPAGNQVDASCNHTMTIDCVRQLYNAVSYNTSATNGNKIAVTAYYNDTANNKDLQQFYKSQNPAAYGSNYTFVSINGGFDDQIFDDTEFESNIDTQIAFGLAHPTSAYFLSTGTPIGLTPFIPDADYPKNDNVPWADWLDYMLSHDYPPQTISTSYGDNEQTVPFTYANRVCGSLAALGARGVSVLFSTGDGGVGGIYTPDPATQQCLSNDGKNKTTFIPRFPASCPYVTAVGGTVHIPETAFTLSGGSFSAYFSQPSYQNTAVTKYLERLAPGTYDGLYNPHGRAYPDVAAQADGFQIIYKGKVERGWGTSCAAPTFAAFVAMLNDARFNAGLPAMGFVNPWLYEKGHAGLNDITVGSNPGCGTQGFNATIGWDPVTGFGTPNFQKLLALAVGNHY